MRELLQDTLSPGALRRSGFVQPQAVALLLQEHLSMKQDHGRALWSLLSFFLWLNRRGAFVHSHELTSFAVLGEVLALMLQI